MSGGQTSSYPRLQRGARHKHLADVPLRLGTFLGGGYDGKYSGYNLSSMLYHHRRDDAEVISLEVWSAPNLSKPSFEEARKQKYKEAKKGDKFGPAWSNHWFILRLRIPPEWRKYERIQLEWNMSGEALVYSYDGEPLQGLAGDSKQFDRTTFPIPMSDRQKGDVVYYIESSCHAMIGQTHDVPDDQRLYDLVTCDLVVPNMEAWRLKWDFELLKEVYEHNPQTSIGQRCLYVANQAMNTFKRGRQNTLVKARDVIAELLGPIRSSHRITTKGKDVASSGSTRGHAVVWALGHCHIDTANLWTFSITQQKSARSWSSQLDLLERYPEYRFTVTQMQQLKWVEQLYPSLFERIRKQVKAGKFEVLGCTWVEMDTNMPSGESLCRQFLYGQRYLERTFGKRSKVFALPDCFGFSTQLPQIARLSGAEYFYTQKISWSLVDHFPHTTFNWVGSDGSQLLAHLSPSDTYSSRCSVDDIRRSFTNHQNLDVSPASILLFGHGDGGGGPNEEMLERLRRVRGLAENNEVAGHIPVIKMDGSFEGFYEHVRQETENGRTLPIWRGELYLERHRACQTSQAAVKKNNRKIEILLRDVEKAATLASLKDSSYLYPKELDVIWEQVLLCQFHDVMAGSGFGPVFDEAKAIYEGIIEKLNMLLFDAEAVVYQDLGLSKSVTSSYFGINGLSGMNRREIVTIDSRNSEPDLVVLETTGTSTSVATPSLELSALSAPRIDRSSDRWTISNSTTSLSLKGGRITSFKDLILGRELISPGETVGLVLMEDLPHDYDAWEIEAYTFEEQAELRFEDIHIVSQTSLRATLGATVLIGDDSHMDLEISLDAVPASTQPQSRSLIRFKATVDWHEKHRFLCFSIPLDINSDFATYDAQFGVIKRPTQRNTSWDAAKYEVCGHQFADLSEWSHGVALINDCKYGYGVEGNVMRLSLLRGPEEPDPNCDMGRHEFSWGLLAHDGGFGESDVVSVARAFNSPLRVRYTVSPPSADTNCWATTDPFRIEGDRNVVLETIKRGEDDSQGKSKTVILRLFEQYGGHARTRLIISDLSVQRAELVNLLEDHIEDFPLDTSGSSSEFSLSFKGYEIKTVRLTIA